MTTRENRRGTLEPIKRRHATYQEMPNDYCRLAHIFLCAYPLGRRCNRTCSSLPGLIGLASLPDVTFLLSVDVDDDSHALDHAMREAPIIALAARLALRLREALLSIERKALNWLLWKRPFDWRIAICLRLRGYFCCESLRVCLVYPTELGSWRNCS